MLEALEQSAIATALRTSFYAYPLVNALHILAIGALATSAIIMDLRVLGLKWAGSVNQTTRLLRPVAMTAIVIAALSGVALFSVQPLDYFANPAFRTKMVLLALALANAGVFVLLKLHRRPDAAVTRILAIASILLWIAVLVAGRFIGFLVG